MEETSSEREERLRGWEAFLNSPEASRALQRADSIDLSERAASSRVRHSPKPIDGKKDGKAKRIELLEENTSKEDVKEGAPPTPKGLKMLLPPRSQRSLS